MTPGPSRLEARPAPRHAPGHNGSITSSSQSSDESEEQTRDNPPLITARGYRCASADIYTIYISTLSTLSLSRGYRSASLPRHSSVSHYRRSVTMPDIKQTAETSNNSNHHNHFEDRTSNLQLTTWLQSLTGASHQPRTQIQRNGDKYYSTLNNGIYIKAALLISEDREKD